VAVRVGGATQSSITSRSSAKVVDAELVGRSSTRQRLIVEAERLFAERGIESVPLADIHEAAGQRNAAAVNYYFRGRDGLIRAIFEYRLAQVSERRNALLDALIAEEAEDRSERLRCLLEARTVPLAEQYCEGHFLGFLARLQTDFGRSEYLMPTHYWNESLALRKRLRAELNDLSDSEFNIRNALVVTLTVHALASHGRLRDVKNVTYQRWVRELVDAQLRIFAS
jgi:AcrR family transcriptional regulator